MAEPVLLGTLFFTAAVAAAGLPPLSGFVGKLYVLRSALATPSAPWVLSVVLGSGLLVIVALSRAGSVLFWRASEVHPLGPVSTAPRVGATGALLAAPLLLMALAHPMSRYARETADQLLDTRAYVAAVMSNVGVSVPAHLREDPH